MKKHHVVILVGPDMTGKTQIAKELAAKLQIPYFKASSEHNVFLTNQEQFINDIRFADPRLVDFIEQTQTSVVMDRGFPCEYVYSAAFNRPTDRKAIHLIDDAYRRISAKIVICLRKNGYEGIFDDLDPKNINSTMLQKIHDLYVEYAHNYLTCKFMFLYVDDEDLNREVSEVFSFLEA